MMPTGAEALGVGRLGRLVEDAILAPSSHNTQPWTFRADGDTVLLLADRSRRLPVNDPGDRELTISCGAALLNLRVAAARDGIRLDVSPLPDPGDPDVLARIAPGHAADPGLARLADALRVRRTHRGPLLADGLPDLGEELIEAAAAEGGVLKILDPRRRRSFATLVAEGDRRQFADPAWRRELASWMRGPDDDEGLVHAPLAAPIARTIVSRFDVGRRTAAKDRRLAEEAPLLAVLGTIGDGPADWLAAGQAMERVLLTAAAHGVQAGFLNQPLQIGELRPRVRDLVPRAGHPQLAIRFGRAERTLPPTPRRRAHAS